MERRSSMWVAATSSLLIALVGLLDYGTGPEIGLSLFYLVPVSLAAWVGPRSIGMLAPFVAALAWLLAEQLGGRAYSSEWIVFWNGGIRAGFFLITALLLERLRDAHQRARMLSRTDQLTGLLNGRCFNEALAAEMSRARATARPFTLAYLDLDHFKEVNDRLGHLTGDAVLQEVARALRSAVRSADVVARMGGDEFAILLPGAGAAESIAIMKRMHAIALAAMGRHGWPVDFSAGAVTFTAAPTSVDEAIRLADDLSREIKQAGRGDIGHAVARLALSPADKPNED